MRRIGEQLTAAGLHWRLLDHPYYTWCGQYADHHIEMVAVETSHGGPAAAWSEEIYLAVDGRPSRWHLQPGGHAAEIANYLRGGRWEAPVGRDLADTAAIHSQGPIVAKPAWLTADGRAFLDKLIAEATGLNAK